MRPRNIPYTKTLRELRASNRRKKVSDPTAAWNDWLWQDAMRRAASVRIDQSVPIPVYWSGQNQQASLNSAANTGLGLGLGVSNGNHFGLGAVQLADQIQNAGFAEWLRDPSKGRAEADPNHAVDDSNVVLGAAWKDRFLGVFEPVARQLRVLNRKFANLGKKLIGGFRG